MRTKLVASLAAATVGAFLVVGCSDNSTDSPMDGHSMGSTSSAPMSSAQASTSAQFNDADVTFAQMMYPHHAQAVEMAAMRTAAPTTRKCCRWRRQSKLHSNQRWTS